MAIYLTEQQLKANLMVNRAIEQWLSVYNENDYTIIRWIRIDKETSGEFSVAYFESFDEGSEDFADIYEFSLKYPDEPFGVINYFDTLEEVLNYTIITYHASIDKFVAAGIIQEEYLNYLSSKN